MKKFNLLPVSFCFLLFLIITCTFSCKKNSSDNTVSVNISGNWAGTTTQPAIAGIQSAETDAFTLSLSQSGTTIAGTFTKGGTSPATGTVSGTINGSNITLTAVTTSTNKGGATLTGAVNVSMNAMNGTYSSQSEGTQFQGTWTMTKTN
jgi:hypothetical protein